MTHDFSDLAAAVLGVGESFLVRAGPGNQQAAVLAHELVHHEPRHLQQPVRGLPAVEHGLAVAARQHDVDVRPLGILEGLLPIAKAAALHFPSRAVARVGRETQITRIARATVERQDGLGQSGRADVFGLRILREGREDVIAQLAGVLERLLVAAVAPVVDQAEERVLLVVQDPVAVVLPALGLRLHVSQVAVGVAGLHQLVDESGRAPADFRVARVGCKHAARVDDLAHADVPRALCRGTLPKGVQKRPFEIQHHVVLVDQVLDASPDLARQLRPREPHRLQRVDDFRLDGARAAGPRREQCDTPTRSDGCRLHDCLPPMVVVTSPFEQTDDERPIAHEYPLEDRRVAALRDGQIPGRRRSWGHRPSLCGKRPSDARQPGCPRSGLSPGRRARSPGPDRRAPSEQTLRGGAARDRSSTRTRPAPARRASWPDSA